MIRIFLGKLGSGKTLHAVKEMKVTTSKLRYYTNIEIKFKNTEFISEDEIIKEVLIEKEKQKPKIEYKLNWEYWNKQKKPLHIIWDEINLTAPSRQSMSKKNMVFTQFVAMARRITGMDEAGYGELTFISQTDFSIEKYIRHLANEILYHIMHWEQFCKDCNTSELRSSESVPNRKCNFCLSENTRKENFFCIVYRFLTFWDFQQWEAGFQGKFYKSREVIFDVEDYFKSFNTIQQVIS